LRKERLNSAHRSLVKAGIQQIVQKAVGGLPQEGTTHICRYDKRLNIQGVRVYGKPGGANHRVNGVANPRANDMAIYGG